MNRRKYRGIAEMKDQRAHDMKSDRFVTFVTHNSSLVSTQSYEAHVFRSIFRISSKVTSSREPVQVRKCTPGLGVRVRTTAAGCTEGSAAGCAAGLGCASSSGRQRRILGPSPPWTTSTCGDTVRLLRTFVVRSCAYKPIVL